MKKCFYINKKVGLILCSLGFSILATGMSVNAKTNRIPSELLNEEALAQKLGDKKTIVLKKDKNAPVKGKDKDAKKHAIKDEDIKKYVTEAVNDEISNPKDDDTKIIKRSGANLNTKNLYATLAAFSTLPLAGTAMLIKKRSKKKI